MAKAADGPLAGSPRIGVFGGTFDPPHIGHLRVARDVVDALDLDRMIWVTAGRPPHKLDRPRSTAEVRHAMVQAATASDARFVASDLEVRRVGPSYTVDTLAALAEAEPGAELFLVIGADQYASFEKWRHPEKILALARLAVMDRDGVAAKDLPLPLPGSAPPVFVSVGRVDVSSTGVRDRIRSGLPVEELLPHGVVEIVEREGLYR